VHLHRLASVASVVAVCTALAACGRTADDGGAAAQPERPPDRLTVPPERVRELTGFRNPESARYDALRDVWYVSNMNGPASARDRNGYISRITGDLERVDTLFIASDTAPGGVALHAPKGMAIVGDTLWVADINALHGFDASSGAHLVTVDLAPVGAVYLNDVSLGPDGAVYVTDTGVRVTPAATTHPGPDRIFRVSGTGAEEVLTFPDPVGPNGIAYDAERGRFVIAPVASPTLFSWTPPARGTSAVVAVGTDPGGGTVTSGQVDSIATGPGLYDGIAVLADGRILVTSWADSTLHVLDNDTLSPFIRGLPSPGDIGIDTLRGLVAIPLIDLGRVEFWTIPSR
jgi:outer membrane protein assembly factor BamB